MSTNLEDDSYDLSWLTTLSEDDEAAVVRLRLLLRDERDPIDRHYMLSEQVVEHGIFDRRHCRTDDEVHLTGRRASGGSRPDPAEPLVPEPQRRRGITERA